MTPTIDPVMLAAAHTEGRMAYCACIRICPYDPIDKPELAAAWNQGWLAESTSRENWPPLLKAQDHDDKE